MFNFDNKNKEILYKNEWKTRKYNVEMYVIKSNNSLYLEISLKKGMNIKKEAIAIQSNEKNRYCNIKGFINNFPAYLNSEISYLKDLYDYNSENQELYKTAFSNVVEFYKRHLK